MKLVALGRAIGLAGEFAGTCFLASLLYGVRATDALTFLAASFVMMAAAPAASYLPARRAARIDRVTAMRSE